MQQHGNICLARLHTLDPGDGVKKSKYFFFISERILLHIKFKGTEYRATFKQNVCPYTHP